MKKSRLVDADGKSAGLRPAFRRSGRRAPQQGIYRAGNFGPIVLGSGISPLETVNVRGTPCS